MCSIQAILLADRCIAPNITPMEVVIAPLQLAAQAFRRIARRRIEANANPVPEETRERLPDHSEPRT